MHVRVMSGALKGVSMYTNEDLFELVVEQGVEQIIKSTIDFSKIIDPTMRVLFEQARRTIEEINRRLDL